VEEPAGEQLAAAAAAAPEDDAIDRLLQELFSPEVTSPVPPTLVSDPRKRPPAACFVVVVDPNTSAAPLRLGLGCVGKHEGGAEVTTLVPPALVPNPRKRPPAAGIIIVDPNTSAAPLLLGLCGVGKHEGGAEAEMLGAAREEHPPEVTGHERAREEEQETREEKEEEGQKRGAAEEAAKGTANGQHKRRSGICMSTSASGRQAAKAARAAAATAVAAADAARLAAEAAEAGTRPRRAKDAKRGAVASSEGLPSIRSDAAKRRRIGTGSAKLASLALDADRCPSCGQIPRAIHDRFCASCGARLLHGGGCREASPGGAAAPRFFGTLAGAAALGPGPVERTAGLWQDSDWLG